MPAKNECQFRETSGLVLCGGKSTRMSADKSLLQYYDKPQRYYLYDMLLPFCEKVFISCNKYQTESIETGYEFIQDAENFGDIGPMIALLTAFTKYPQQNILLVGCDYPFLTVAELQLFCSHCKNKPAAFYNQQDDVYEPMLAWYPYSCLEALKEMHATNRFSLQQFLKQKKAAKYLPLNLNCINSIDSKEAFALALKQINEE